MTTVFKHYLVILLQYKFNYNTGKLSTVAVLITSEPVLHSQIIIIKLQVEVHIDL